MSNADIKRSLQVLQKAGQDQVAVVKREADVMYDIFARIGEAQNAIEICGGSVVPTPPTPPPTSPTYYSIAPRSKVAAYPGAQGYGADTYAGRGGQVIPVITLASSGPGSLAEAVATRGARNIVFFVAGTITLPEYLQVADGNMSLYAGVAPGPVEIRGNNTIGRALLGLEASDCLVTDLAIRVGASINRNCCNGSVGVYGNDNVLMHNSMSFGTDEILETYQSKRTCIQENIISEPLHNSTDSTGSKHGFAVIMDKSSSHVSFHRNLMMHSAGRNPLAQGDYIDVVNNISAGGIRLGSNQGKHNNWVNNLGIHFGSIPFWTDFGFEPADGFLDTVYVSGNKSQVMNGEILEARLFDENINDRAANHLTDMSIFSAFANAHPEVATIEAALLEASLIQTVGAHRRNRSDTDIRILRQLAERTGFVTDCAGGQVPTSANNNCALDVPWPALTQYDANPNIDLDAIDKVPNSFKVASGGAAIHGDGYDTTQQDSNEDGITDFEDWVYAQTGV